MARLDNLDYEVNGGTVNYEIVPEIAPLFNATTAYAAGDQVIHEGIRYKFTTAHPAGAWIGTDVEEMPTVAEELTSHSADITELKADLRYSKGIAEETKNGLALYEPENLLDITRVTNGYITKDGNVSQSTSHFYTDYIPVEEGDVIGFYDFSGVGMIGRGTISARFLAAYDANKAIISSAGSDATVSSYTVPNGVAYIRPTLAMAYKTLNPFISKNGAPISYYEGFRSKLVPQAQAGRHFYRYKCDSSFFNETFEIPTMSLCKNTIISFSGYVASFTFLTFKLSIGQGSDHFGAAWIDIDKDNVTWHLYTSSDSSYPQAHGLPFGTVTSGQISISIIVDDNTKAKLKIEYGGQQYTRTLGFYGFSNQPFFVTSSAIAIEKETFSVTNKDFDAPVFTFGDSYIAIIESESKWTHYYVADGFGDNMCINAFPGADSTELEDAFANTLAIATPQKILWCVGMNDGADVDSSTPNAQWLASVENMLAVCKAKNIEPLFVTIPTVPTVNNEAKNKWIRESGYRFADFALAVGANSSGVWNTDMLSSDGVHPSALGAKAMYYQLMADLPDLFV